MTVILRAKPEESKSEILRPCGPQDDSVEGIV